MARQRSNVHPVIVLLSLIFTSGFIMAIIALVQSNENRYSIRTVTSDVVDVSDINGLVGFWGRHQQLIPKKILYAWARFDGDSGKMLKGEIGHSIIYEYETPVVFSPGNSSHSLIGIMDGWSDQTILIEYNPAVETYYKVPIIDLDNHTSPSTVIYDSIYDRYIGVSFLTPLFDTVLTIIDYNTGVLYPFTGYNGASLPDNLHAGAILLGNRIVVFTRGLNLRVYMYDRGTGQAVSNTIFNGTFIRSGKTTYPSLSILYTSNIDKLVYTGMAYDPTTYTLYVSLGDPEAAFTDIGKIEATSESDLLAKLTTNDFQIKLATHQPARVLQSLAWIQ